jgi:hypothetical protein
MVDIRITAVARLGAPSRTAPGTTAGDPVRFDVAQGVELRQAVRLQH